MNLETTWPQNAGDRIAELEARVAKLETMIEARTSVELLRGYYGITKGQASMLLALSDGGVHFTTDLARTVGTSVYSIRVYASTLRSATIGLQKGFKGYLLSPESLAEVKKVLKGEL